MVKNTKKSNQRVNKKKQEAIKKQRAARSQQYRAEKMMVKTGNLKTPVKVTIKEKKMKPKKQNTKNAKEPKQVIKTKEKRISFKTLEIDDDASFHDFEQHPETAIMLWHVNSGRHRFNSVGDLSTNQKRTKVIQEILAEKVTTNEKHHLVNEFSRASGKDKFFSSGDDYGTKLLTCGSCGMKKLEASETRYYNANLLDLAPLELSDDDMTYLEELYQPKPIYGHN